MRPVGGMSSAHRDNVQSGGGSAWMHVATVKLRLKSKSSRAAELLAPTTTGIAKMDIDELF
jgi:hypothetical protein